MKEIEFYSYMWLREDGTPYYVGKGKKKRAFVSRGHGSLNCPKDKSRILIFPQLCEADTFESEIELIKLFGRKDNGTGILRNLTDGGDGVAGYQITDRQKKQISDRFRGKPQSSELIAKRAASLRKWWEDQSEEVIKERGLRVSKRTKAWYVEQPEEIVQARKDKMSRLGDKHTAAAKVKMSLARRGKTPNKGNHHSEETKTKMSKAHTGRPWSDARRAAQEKRKGVSR